MGQYWHAFTEKLNGEIKGYEPNGGLKLMEHSWLGNNYTNFITANIYNEPTRIWTVGDYWNDGEFMDKLPKWWFERLSAEEYKEPEYANYNVWNYEVNEPTFSKYDDIAEDIKYFINYSKKEYIAVDELIPIAYKDEKYHIYPITLLTAISNGEGGGDYYGSCEDMVGYWAGDWIASSKEEPNDSYTKIQTIFKE